jgi:hypothetical protein
MRGRKPSSTEEKLAKGETRPSRVNYDEPEILAPASTDPPKDLKGVGLELWKRYAKAMVASGQLRSTDMPLFLQRCRTETDIERWEKEKSRRNLDRSERLSIERVLNQLKSRALRESAELGMSSVSRSKVRTVTKAPVEKPKHDRFFGKAALNGLDRDRNTEESEEPKVH